MKARHHIQKIGVWITAARVKQGGEALVLTLLLEAVSLPIASPRCRDIGTCLELLDQREHGLVAQTQGHTGAGVRVKPHPLAGADDDLHVTLQSVDVPRETVALFGPTDLQEELGYREWRSCDSHVTLLGPNLSDVPPPHASRLCYLQQELERKDEQHIDIYRQMQLRLNIQI